MSHDVLVAYRHQLGTRRLPKGGVASDLMESLDAVLFDTERSRLFYEAPVIPGTYEDRDKHMVSAVVAASPAVLVTFDRPLIDSLSHDLADESNPDAKGFKVMDPLEALTALCLQAGS